MNKTAKTINSRTRLMDTISRNIKAFDLEKEARDPQFLSELIEEIYANFLSPKPPAETGVLTEIPENEVLAEVELTPDLGDTGEEISTGGRPKHVQQDTKKETNREDSLDLTAIDAKLVIDTLRHADFDVAQFRAIRDVAGDLLIKMGCELEDATLPSVTLSASAQTAVDAIVSVESSVTRNRLEIATSLGLATEAFGEFVKEMIEPVIDEPISKHERTPWLSGAMRTLSMVVGSASRWGTWCLQWVKPDRQGSAPVGQTRSQKFATIVFCDQSPSEAGLRAFLIAASKKEYKTVGEKRVVRSAINHWKAEFGGSLRYKGETVKLAVTGGAKGGQFALYTESGSDRKYCYGDRRFPEKLTYQKKS